MLLIGLCANTGTCRCILIILCVCVRAWMSNQFNVVCFCPQDFQKKTNIVDENYVIAVFLRFFVHDLVSIYYIIQVACDPHRYSLVNFHTQGKHRHLVSIHYLTTLV